MIYESYLGIDHIVNRYHGKTQGVGPPGVGVDRAGSRGTFAASNNVGTDHKILSRVEGLARANHNIPPAGIPFMRVIEAGGVGVAGKSVKNQNGIVFGRTQLPIGLVSQSNGPEASSALKKHLAGRCSEGKGLGFNDSYRIGVIHWLLPRPFVRGLLCAL